MSIQLAPRLVVSPLHTRGHGGSSCYYHVLLKMEGFEDGLLLNDRYETSKAKAMAFAEKVATGLSLLVEEE